MLCHHQARPPTASGGKHGHENQPALHGRGSAAKPRSRMSRCVATTSPRIELDVGVAAQRVLPQQQQQHGRREQRQRAVQVDGAELAALDAAGEHAADQRHALEHHLLGVEPGEGGEIAGFRHHQLGDGGQVGVQQQQEALGDGAQDVGGGAVGVGQQGGGGLQVGQHGLADDGAEQVLLGGEVKVDRALADAGGGGDVLQLGGGKAAVGEQAEGGLDDFAGAGLLAASAAPGRVSVSVAMDVTY